VLLVACPCTNVPVSRLSAMRQRRTYETDPYLLETEDDDDDDDDDDDNSSSSSESRNCNWKVLTGIFIIQVCFRTSEDQNDTSHIARMNTQAIDFAFHGFSCSQSIYKTLYRSYLYCCTVHFEDSLSSAHQQMHYLYVIY
jgi:hypothetical protein